MTNLQETEKTDLWKSHKARVQDGFLDNVKIAWQPFNGRQMIFEMELEERSDGFLLHGVKIAPRGKRMDWRIELADKGSLVAVERIAERESDRDLVLINESIPGFPEVRLKPAWSDSGRVKGYVGAIRDERVQARVKLTPLENLPGDISGETWVWSLYVWLLMD